MKLTFMTKLTQTLHVNTYVKSVYCSFRASRRIPQPMTSHLKMVATALLIVACAPAQTFDTSGNSTLKGDYFVREVLMTGNTDGTVTKAVSVIGTATFDGNGNYTFTGQGTSLASGPNAAISRTGT